MTNITSNVYSYIGLPAGINSGPVYDIDPSTGRLGTGLTSMTPQACLQACDASPLCPGVLIKTGVTAICYGRQLYTGTVYVPFNNYTVNNILSASTQTTYFKVPFAGIVNNCADFASNIAAAPSVGCKDFPATVPAAYQAALAPIKLIDATKPYKYFGCFKTSSASGSRYLAVNITSTLSQVTPATCALACSVNFYPFSSTEFGKHCYCGQYVDTAQQGIDTLCNYACLSNSTLSCGGNGYTDVYAPNPPVSFTDASTGVSVYYRGCFSDFAGNRTMSAQMTVSNVTPARCVAACASAGYVIAGVEYGAECFCHIVGNSSLLTVSIVDAGTASFFQTGAGAANQPSFGAANTCTMPCSGDSNQICGGSNSLSVYTWTAANTTLPIALALDSTNNPRSLNTQYVGCAVDDTTNRILSKSVNTNTTLSGLAATSYPVSTNPNNCQEVCYQRVGYSTAGSTFGQGATGYFGVESSSECWCDTSLQRTPVFRPSSECNMPCLDGSGQMCGGINRLQLYKYTTAMGTASIIPNAIDTGTYVGCYADSGYRISTGYAVGPSTSGRVLTGLVSYQDSFLSYGVCATICRRSGYSYMGMSSSKLCFCDTVVRPSLGPGTCNVGPGVAETFVASGNNTSMAVWKLTPLPWLKAVEPGVFDTANSIGAYNFGCADDSTTARILPFRASLAAALLTPKNCVNTCAYSGYLYSGVEFGSECWCGNTGYTNYPYNANQVCSTMGCSGNSSQQCGGPNIMSVYFNGQIRAASGFAGLVSASNSYTLVGCASDLYPISRLLKFTAPVSPGNLTVDICTAACAQRGFPYAALEYGQECYCDASFSATLQTTNQACVTPCKGDSTSFCGGPNSLAVYYNSASAQLGIVSNFTDFKGQSVSFYGCFSDNSASLATRTFPNKLTISAPNTMTPQICIQLCTNGGYAYAGLEYGLECWCSNAAPSTSLQLSVDSCSMKCAGASNLLCGSGNVLSVYFSAKASSASTVGSSGGGSLLGCFTDSATDPTQSYSNGASLAVSGGRVLAGTRIDLGAANTVELCIATCSSYGYTLAGVFNGVSCFCDTTQRSSIASSQCTTPCAGDSTELCGGSAAVQVYTTNSATVPIVGSIFSTSLTTASFYMGCAIDSITSRVLPTGPNVAVAGSNTPQICLDTCTRLGYIYAGVEFGSECWCGSVAPTLLPLSRQAECAGKTCSGNSAVACGAGNRIAVYSNGNVAAAVTYMASSGSFQLLGCAADSISSRTLSTPIFLSGGMTVPACLAACAAGNFYYAGVEYASECYCGSFFTSSKVLPSNATCNMPCTGAANTYCGGANAINIYQNPSITRGNVASFTSGALTWKYMSCWGEPGSGRAFAIQLNNPSRTVQSCLTLGTQGGYTACGLEYGGECWCSQATQPSAGGQISEAYCSTTAANVQYGMTCAGNPTQWCGSGNVLSWYGTGTQSYTLSYSYP